MKSQEQQVFKQSCICFRRCLLSFPSIGPTQGPTPPLVNSSARYKYILGSASCGTKTRRYYINRDEQYGVVRLPRTVGVLDCGSLGSRFVGLPATWLHSGNGRAAALPSSRQLRPLPSTRLCAVRRGSRRCIFEGCRMTDGVFRISWGGKYTNHAAPFVMTHEAPPLTCGLLTCAQCISNVSNSLRDILSIVDTRCEPCHGAALIPRTYRNHGSRSVRYARNTRVLIILIRFAIKRLCRLHHRVSRACYSRRQRDDEVFGASAMPSVKGLCGLTLCHKACSEWLREMVTVSVNRTKTLLLFLLVNLN